MIRRMGETYSGGRMGERSERRQNLGDRKRARVIMEVHIL